MKWNRIRYCDSIILLDGTLRFYVDGVREDGFLYRAGVDLVAGSTLDAQTQADLMTRLNYFLDKGLRAQQVGPDAYKGDPGWAEV